MGRKSASGSGIRDEQPGSYFKELRNNFFDFFGVELLKFFEDPGSGMETVRIRDPGWKKVGSATLPSVNCYHIPGGLRFRAAFLQGKAIVTIFQVDCALGQLPGIKRNDPGNDLLSSGGYKEMSSFLADQ
jgi:hypothetical protein